MDFRRRIRGNVVGVVVMVVSTDETWMLLGDLLVVVEESGKSAVIVIHNGIGSADKDAFVMASYFSIIIIIKHGIIISSALTRKMMNMMLRNISEMLFSLLFFAPSEHIKQGDIFVSVDILTVIFFETEFLVIIIDLL